MTEPKEELAAPTGPEPVRKTTLGGRLRQLVAYLVTLSVVCLALLLIVDVWYLYLRAPWTRDAFVRVEVTDIAPEGVSGYVTNINVSMNQRVQKGDLLFEIDPTRYQLAVEQAQADLKALQAQAAMDFAFAESRIKAGPAVSEEDRQTYMVRAETSQLLVESARAALGLAQYNLFRTQIFAPTHGYVANLTLRVGDFAQSGHTALVLLDQDSFWVEAYFQETKIANIKPGDLAAISLMAHEKAFEGEVISISRGIANANNDSGALGLQQINPVDSWVRLAQRIPVFIKIKQLPEGLPLVAGMTASVSAGELAEQALNPTNLFERLTRWFTFYL